MSEANEMYEGIQTVIDEMIEEYKDQDKFYGTDIYRCQSQIDCLVELKRRINDN